MVRMGPAANSPIGFRHSLSITGHGDTDGIRRLEIR
jgi:hypothetical protein